MITCPKCKTGPAKNIFTDILRPDNDKFKCKECGLIFYRYDSIVDYKVNGKIYKVYCHVGDCVEINLFKQYGIDADKI